MAFEKFFGTIGMGVVFVLIICGAVKLALGAGAVFF